MILEEIVLEVCHRYENKLRGIEKDVTPAEHAIYPSEMLMMCSLCEEFKIQYIVESGRQFGYSTQILAEWFPKIPIDSIDLEEPTTQALQRLVKHSNVIMKKGNGCDEVLRVVKSIVSKHTAILLDGPKDKDALAVVYELRDYIDFAFVHDMRGVYMPQWIRGFPFFVTCDAGFQKTWSHLDARFLTELGYAPAELGGGMGVFDLREWRK